LVQLVLVAAAARDLDDGVQLIRRPGTGRKIVPQVERHGTLPSAVDGSGVRQEPDELGAHVSAAGGVSRAPERAAQLGAAVLQLFTKAPGQWAEPQLDADEVSAFHGARREPGIRTVAWHGS